MEHRGKVYKIIIDPAANDRMYEHFEFLARIGADAANRLLKSLLADIRSLKTLPFGIRRTTARICPAGKYRDIIYNKRYRVIYQVDGDFVFVDDIQDCRQDEDKSMLNPLNIRVSCLGGAFPLSSAAPVSPFSLQRRRVRRRFRQAR